MKKVMIATGNPNKVKQYVKVFTDLGIEVMTNQDFPNLVEVDETGLTYNENAQLKSEYAAKNLNITAIGEDFGLDVTHLYGTKYGKDMPVPGVYSARYASDHDDKVNVSALLKALENVEDRTASYNASLAITDVTGNTDFINIKIKGTIAEQVEVDGFAYDTVFIPEGKTKTLSQLGASWISENGFRAQLADKLLVYLKSKNY